MKLLKRARIAHSNGTRIVYIAFDRVISAIYDELPDDTEFDEVIDLDGKLVLPGCIDAHVHFNDPGFTEREDFFTGTSAAAAGGITTVIDMPCTSLPPVTDTEALERKLEAISGKAVVDYALWGGIRGNDSFSEKRIEQLWDEGVTGFKIYTISGMETFEALSYPQIERIFRVFDGSGIMFGFHAEEADVIDASILDSSDWKNFPHIRSVEAESEAIRNILSLQHNNRVHFVHVSSRKGAELILEAKRSGKDVTFETCPHYLEFVWKDFEYLRGKLKTVPPMKFPADRHFLREAVMNGAVDFITTDHAGVEYESGKNCTRFEDIYCGIPGTQTMVPFILSEFYVRRGVPLDTIANLLSTNSAKRHGLYPRKGSLEVGSDADFTVIDMDGTEPFDEQNLRCKGRYSPFQGRTFSVKIDKTIVRGRTVYDQTAPDVVKPGLGEWIRRVN